MASESTTAANMSASVWMAGSHRPISANEMNAASTVSPARQPPKRHTNAVPATIVPSQVIHSSRFSIAVTSQSAKARNASSSAKNGFDPSVRCSSSQSCALSISRGSSSQTSDAGHG